MSASSFPRPEHIVLLRQRIEARARERGWTIEVAERGLNHYKCQYKFGLRRQPEEEWVELAIHFQIAERLQATGSAAELNHILDGILNRLFSA